MQNREDYEKIAKKSESEAEQGTVGHSGIVISPSKIVVLSG